jgi:hypothetical protein
MMGLLNATTTLFWAALTVTILTWVLRGIGILTFLPGGIIWLLLLLTLGLGGVSLLQRSLQR